MLAPVTHISYSQSVKWTTGQLAALSKLESRLNELSVEQRTLFLSIRQIQKERALSLSQQISLFQSRKSSDTVSSITPRVAPRDAVNYILLKPVSDGCNLKCSYCYEGPKGIRNELKQMTEETLKRIIDEACSQGVPKIGFSFHGGEPLLAGIGFFRKAMEFQEPWKNKGILIENTVQTNGTLLNDEWIRFFKNNRFAIGTSFDGIRNIHDKYRIFHNGKGSYDRLVGNIRKLQKSGMNFGIISVITNEHRGRAREHFNVFMELGINDFAVTPAFGLIEHLDVGTVTAANFSDYTIEMFEEWLQSGRDDVKIRVVTDALKGFLGDTLTICSLAGTCTKIVAIEPNGDVKSCTRSCGEAEKIFGNILETDLDRIVTGPAYESFRIQEKAGQKSSGHCQWFEICHGGCSANRTSNGKVDVSGKGRFCDCDALPGTEKGYAGIYRHIRNRAEELLDIPA